MYRKMPSSEPYLPALAPPDLLSQATEAFGRDNLARRLDVSRKTIARWASSRSPIPIARQLALREVLRAVPVPQEGAEFTFVDLFAGIGGIRAGLAAAGGRCVFTSEWNPFARKTYLANFGAGEPIAGDITTVNAEQIPDHDLLAAGFPCQPFSIAGVSKKNALGRPHGFACETQGTLFFDVARIIESRQPKAFLLENVKNLLSHDGGNTFRVIRQTLESLGYTLDYRVIDGQAFVPQHRERVLIVGFREPTAFSFDDLLLPSGTRKLSSILHPEDGSESAEPPYTAGPLAQVNPKYALTPGLWRYLRAYAEKHRQAGNGFGFGLTDGEGTARTLSARYYKDGSEILIRRSRGRTPRRLTPRECARLMGFPDTFKIPVSDTQAYKQFGNSVVVPVIREVALAIKPHLLSLGRFEQTGAWQLPLIAGRGRT